MESRDKKAARLLTERRVRVLCADEESIVASVRGDHELYHVSLYREGNRLVRECSCDYSLHHPINCDCSHTRAVGFVWTYERSK